MKNIIKTKFWIVNMICALGIGYIAVTTTDSLLRIVDTLLVLFNGYVVGISVSGNFYRDIIDGYKEIMTKYSEMLTDVAKELTELQRKLQESNKK